MALNEWLLEHGGLELDGTHSYAITWFRDQLKALTIVLRGLLDAKQI